MRLPRPCRLRNGWLSVRSLTPARQFRIGEPFSGDLTHRQREAVSVVEGIVFRSAIVVPKHLLRHIAVKVERLYCNVGSAKAALQERPEVLDALSVNLAAHVLFDMVNSGVDIVLCLESVVSRMTVCVDRGTVFNLFQNLV